MSKRWGDNVHPCRTACSFLSISGSPNDVLSAAFYRSYITFNSFIVRIRKPIFFIALQSMPSTTM